MVQYYGIDRYWNEIPAVVAHLSRLSTGDPSRWWMEDFKSRYADPPRRRALVLACGNGWVERSLFDLDVARHFDAFDVSPQLVAEAEESRGDRAITYQVSDFASFDPEPQSYDLVVNHAALHHAHRLYRAVRVAAEALSEDGVLVSWEYVGPSRYQYRSEHLALIHAANESLPQHLRSPHPLPPRVGRSMVSGDPSEAVHSGEIRRAVEHWFEIVEWHDLGGGIAYHLLWNNVDGFLNPNERAAREALATLLRLDEELTCKGAIPTLFAYFVAKPRRAPRQALAAAFDLRVKEPFREAFAARAMNLYPGELGKIAREHGRTSAERLVGRVRER
jgi:SAM-dependent methyltransferase